MPTFNCDNLVSDALATAVDSSTPVMSRNVNLNGVQAVSIQAQCTGGAAGTLYVDGCNQRVPSANNQLPASTPVNWLNFTTQVLTANQQAILSYSLVDQVCTMHNVRVRFVPTAAGSITASINARRMTD